MNKKSVLISVVVIGLSGLMGGTLVRNKKELESRKEVTAVNDRIAVTTATAAIRETSGLVELTGVTEPVREVVVASESAGKIVKINFKLGDPVSKGMVLAEVDDTYKRLAFENAQLNYNKFKDDYERYQVLRQGDAVSENQLREMKIGFEQAGIQLEDAQKQWEDTKITAPFSGVITSKSTELGTYVHDGTPIAGIADIAQLKISLTVSETHVYQLRKGQEVSVSTTVYPGITYKGTLSAVSPQGSEAHTFPVEAIIANDRENPLKAGTYVQVRVDTGKTGKALMIPRDAIVSSVKDPSVYVVKDETAELVKINTGNDYGSYLEVTSGLQEGDRIVTNGQINLMNGAKVSIIN